jgi:hypothetical protein
VCNVRVLDSNGTILAEWRDAEGQLSGGPERLHDSMQWTAPDRLGFETVRGPVELTIR